MSRISTRQRAAGIAGVTVLAMAALAACGSSDGTTAAASASTPSTTASPEASSSAGAGSGQGNGNRGGFDAATQTKITACLKAAGITVPTMGARPTGAPGGDGTMPTGAPPNGGTRPTGAPDGSGNRGPGGGIFGSTEAQAALKACGITLPSRPAGAPTGAASASTT